MTKNEFISELKMALADELPQSEIENNIYYYDSYMREQMLNESEEAVLEKLGDPRLIAKTIIETYQLSHDRLYNMKHRADYEEGFTKEWSEEKVTQESYSEDPAYGDESNSFNIYGSYHMKWYHKLLLGVILALIFVVVIFVGGIILKLFFTVGVPLLLIYFIYRLIANNRNR